MAFFLFSYLPMLLLYPSRHPPAARVVAAALVGEEGLAVHQGVWQVLIQSLRQHHTYNPARDGHQTQDDEGNSEPNLRL